MTHLRAAGALLPLVLAACNPEETPSNGTNGTAPAVLVAERFNTPDGRIMYMGAFPTLPDAPVGVDQLVELAPDGDVFACGGYAFFYDSDQSRITRYSVSDDYVLTESGALLVGQQGIQGWTGANVCASDDVAYLFNETGGAVVKFDPQEMVLLDTLELPLPEGVGETQYLQFFEPYRAGELVYFPLEAIDWDTLEVAGAMVAVFDLATEALTYTYEEGCISGLAGHVDGAGNFYRLGGYGAFFGIYGPGAAPDCVLRIPSGQTAFDTFKIELTEPTRDMWAIDDEHVLVLFSDGIAPPAEDLFAWWDLPVSPERVNLITGERVPYDSVPPVAPQNSRKIALDGRMFYQVYTFGDDGLVEAVDLVELGRDGVTPAFRVEGGDILALERIR